VGRSAAAGPGLWEGVAAGSRVPVCAAATRCRGGRARAPDRPAVRPVRPSARVGGGPSGRGSG